MSQTPSRKTFRARFDDMVKTLRSRLASGQYAPGTYLPSVEALSEQFNMSINSVRKGLDTLAAEGWIETIPRVGSRVCPRSIAAAADTTLILAVPHTFARDAALEELLDRFHAQYPHIKVQPTIVPETTPRSCVESGVFDVVALTYPGFEELAENGLLPALEVQEERSDIYPFLTESFKQDGVLRAQPFLFSPVVLCYNKDHFRESGLLEPDSGWSWDTLLEQAEKLTRKPERYGLFFLHETENRWLPFLMQSGQQFVRREDGTVSLRGTKLMDSLSFCRDIVANEAIFPRGLRMDAQTLLLKQRASIILTTYFGLNMLKDAPFEFDVSPLPRLHTPDTLLLVMGLAVHARSANAEAARELVRFLTSAEAQTLISRHAFSIPAVKPVAEASVPERDSRVANYHMFRHIIPTFRLHKDLKMDYRMVARLREELLLFWSGLDDEDALALRLESQL